MCHVHGTPLRHAARLGACAVGDCENLCVCVCVCAYVRAYMCVSMCIIMHSMNVHACVHVVCVHFCVRACAWCKGVDDAIVLWRHRWSSHSRTACVQICLDGDMPKSASRLVSALGLGRCTERKHSQCW